MSRRCSAKIKRKYKEYGINERPFVVVKPDAGSSGMGILTVRDAEGPGRARSAAAGADAAPVPAR